MLINLILIQNNCSVIWLQEEGGVVEDLPSKKEVEEGALSKKKGKRKVRVLSTETRDGDETEEESAVDAPPPQSDICPWEDEWVLSLSLS